eukprot:4023711-Pleurochrysis_carterae.AAC.1
MFGAAFEISPPLPYTIAGEMQSPFAFACSGALVHPRASFRRLRAHRQDARVRTCLGLKLLMPAGNV